MKYSYHDGINNVVVVVLERSYSLHSRYVGLWHHQLNVLHLHASLINLQSMMEHIGSESLLILLEHNEDVKTADVINNVLW